MIQTAVCVFNVIFLECEMSRNNEPSKYILKNERRGIATPVTNVHKVLTM